MAARPRGGGPVEVEDGPIEAEDGTDTQAADIDFAIRMGQAEVRENNVYRADTTFAAGDLFKVAVEGGVVKYSKNGVVFYTSTVAPTYPLLVDSSLLSAGATITNATME